MSCSFIRYFREHLQLYVPRDTSINRDFLKQVLAGEKRLLKIADVKYVTVPRFDELSVINLHPKFKEDPKFNVYMPDQMTKGKSIDREYFFNVLNTVHPEYLSKIMAHANEQRMTAAGEANQS